jgi:hypothetical protein
MIIGRTVNCAKSRVYFSSIESFLNLSTLAGIRHLQYEFFNIQDIVFKQLVPQKLVYSYGKSVAEITFSFTLCQPIPVAARSKAWVCGRSLAGIVGSNDTEGMDVCLL